MTTNRTPRQAPGDGLTPVTVQVPKALKQALFDRAATEQRSVSYVAREALQRYLDPKEAR